MRLNGTAHCQNALLAVMFKHRPVLPIVCVVFLKTGSRHAEVAPRDASLGSRASNTSQDTTQNLVLASDVGDEVASATRCSRLWKVTPASRAPPMLNKR